MASAVIANAEQAAAIANDEQAPAVANDEQAPAVANDEQAAAIADVDEFERAIRILNDVPLVTGALGLMGVKPGLLSTCFGHALQTTMAGLLKNYRQTLRQVKDNTAEVEQKILAQSWMGICSVLVNQLSLVAAYNMALLMADTKVGDVWNRGFLPYFWSCYWFPISWEWYPETWGQKHTIALTGCLVANGLVRYFADTVQSRIAEEGHPPWSPTHAIPGCARGV
jgi:hypothetical protein